MPGAVDRKIVTVSEIDRLYLDNVVADTEEIVDFYSEPRKRERERSYCAALLRCLGVHFRLAAIETFPHDPPDVLFHLARFEVREVLDIGRRRVAELQAELQQRKHATRIRDLLEPYRSPRSLTWDNLIERVTKELNQKAQRYGFDFCTSLDALVYVNLKMRRLDPSSSLPRLRDLRNQGWRSVSLLVPPYALVLHARHTAPQFLRDLVGQIKHEWNRVDGLFDLGIRPGGLIGPP